MTRRSRNLAAFAVLGLLTLTLAGLASLGTTTAAAASAEPSIAERRLFKILAPKDDGLMRGDRLRVKLALRDDVSLREARA